MDAQPWEHADWLAAEQRDALIGREDALARRMILLYRGRHARYREIVDEISQQLATTQMLAPAQRMRKLQPLLEKLQQHERTDKYLAERAAKLTEQGQRLNLNYGAEDADAFAELIAGNAEWRSLPMEALTHSAGMSAEGRQELQQYFAELQRETYPQFRQTLFDGIMSGKSPARIARRRCVLMAREEMVRAYREGSLATYRHNAELVIGWRWQAVLSPRTCACCIALHGSIHPLSEPFNSHLLCRCCAVPVSRTDLDKHGPSGEEWFAQQPDEVQAQILGPAHVKLYHEGLITLSDMVDRHETVWGATAHIRSVKELVAHGLVTEAVAQGALARHVNSYEEQMRWHDVNFGTWTQKLSHEEQDALAVYHSRRYKEINQYLRGDIAQAKQDIPGIVQSLDSAISKGRIQEDTVVYRGFGTQLISADTDPESLIAKFIPNSGYTSASLRNNYAASFAVKNETPVLVKCVLPTGTHAAYIAGEAEVVLPRGTRLLVTSAEKHGKMFVLEARVVLP
jgi:hypothetical protein